MNNLIKEIDYYLEKEKNLKVVLFLRKLKYTIENKEKILSNTTLFIESGLCISINFFLGFYEVQGKNKHAEFYGLEEILGHIIEQNTCLNKSYDKTLEIEIKFI